MPRTAYVLMLIPWASACSSSTTTVSNGTIAGMTNTVVTGGASADAAGAGGTALLSGGAGGVLAIGGSASSAGGVTGGNPPTGGTSTISQSDVSGGKASSSGNTATGGNSAASQSGLGGNAPTGGSSVAMQSGAGGGSTGGLSGATGGTNGSGGAATGGLGTICTTSASKCGGAEVETTALKCRTDQTGYDVVAYCSDSSTQCNPAVGSCFSLGIDPTEVTRAQYAAFLAAGSVVQVAGCSSINATLSPDATCMANAAVCQGSNCDSQPQVCVDWCDAYAYCNKLGKRLCGRIGGGMNPFDRAADPGSSQWMNACSAGGQYKYGSGSRVDSGPSFCNYVGTQLGTAYAVGTHAGCTSPSPTYDTIFDLSGNVAEWEDSCEKPIDPVDLIGGADACRTRGGSFNSPLAALSCDAVPASALRRDATAPDVGFRCCSN